MPKFYPVTDHPPDQDLQPVFSSAKEVGQTAGMNVGVLLTALIACAVEMVEAATIVLAVGVSTSWRTAFKGGGAAVVALVLMVVVGGPLVDRISLTPLRLIAGSLNLLIGFDWLRKAILRSAGVKAKRNEAVLFKKAVAQQSAADTHAGMIVAFKGVFLEGLEVVVIVLTVGLAQQNLFAASLGAACALVSVVGVAALVRKPLSRVPENGMKLVVGVMLVSFGTFWAASGLGVDWPIGDASLLVLGALYAATTVSLVSLVAQRTRTLA